MNRWEWNYHHYYLRKFGRLGFYLQVTRLLTDPRIKPTHLQGYRLHWPRFSLPHSAVAPQDSILTLSYLIFQPHWALRQSLNMSSPPPPLPHALPALLHGMLCLCFAGWQTLIHLLIILAYMSPLPKPNPTYNLKLEVLDVMINPEGNWEQAIQNNLMGFIFIGNQISERTFITFIIIQQELHLDTLNLPMGRGEEVSYGALFFPIQYI